MFVSIKGIEVSVLNMTNTRIRELKILIADMENSHKINEPDLIYLKTELENLLTFKDRLVRTIS